MSDEGSLETAASGAQLGRYQLVSQIAVGGMAEIYVARMEGYAGSDRLCVIKKIKPRIGADPRAVKMFLDEARIAAALQHPNIVQMFEVGEMDGAHFIAMEYLHGEDVRTVMRTLTKNRLPLPLDHAIHIVVDMLAGLHYAHEQRGIDGQPLGIVHRDISPHNVFITYDGAVKLVDFGIAKASNRETQTKVETLKGKIHYMSPEQCRCIDLDRRSDIFSAGVVLYELSTGRRLNKGDDEYEVMKRTVEGPLPRPSEIVEGYPKPLEDIVRMALQKSPEDRFQSALSMQQALENFSHERHLRRSNIELSKFMQRAFSERIARWERGVADGTSIKALVEARHVTRTASSSDADSDGGLGHLVTFPQGEANGEPKRSASDAARTSSELPADHEVYPSIAIAADYSSAAATTPSRRTPETIDQSPGPAPLPTPPPNKNRRALAMALIVLGCAAAAAVVFAIQGRSNDASNPAPDAMASSEVASHLAGQDAEARRDAGPNSDAADEPSDGGGKSESDASVEPASVADDEKARIRIRANVDAEIFVDGRPRGVSPKTIGGLEAGWSRVELRKSGYQGASKRLRLRQGKTTSWRVQLKPIPKTPPPKAPGDVRVKSFPSAKIFLDGKSKGFSSKQFAAAAGSHVLRLVIADLGIDKTLRINVPDGGTVKVRCKADGSKLGCSVE